MSATYLMPTYNRQPISFTRGAGSWLYTKDDTPYLDALTWYRCMWTRALPSTSH